MVGSYKAVVGASKEMDTYLEVALWARDQEQSLWGNRVECDYSRFRPSIQVS